jgi:hypothetical protein
MRKGLAMTADSMAPANISVKRNTAISLGLPRGFGLVREFRQLTRMGVWGSALTRRSSEFPLAVASQFAESRPQFKMAPRKLSFF